MLSTELAHKLGCTEDDIINIKHEFHLKTRIKVECHECYQVFSDEDSDFVIKIFNERKAEKIRKETIIKAEKEKQFQQSLKQLRKEHPLVTDDRCFRLSWWPEVLPSVLEEREDA